MEAFSIQIAGLVTHVQPLFISTQEYCRPYLTDLEPEFFVEVTEADLAYQQELMEKEALEEGFRIRKYGGPFLERATIQRKIAYELLNRDTLLLHGSTVGVDGAAYLFTARCGTGKSTHTRFWREIFGQRAVMVNDDKPFLKITSSGVYAYGSPWSGKHGLDTNITVPLQGICILQRGTENQIRRITPEEAIPMLLHQSYRPLDSGKGSRFEELVSLLADKTPLWQMACNMDPSAAEVSHSAMCR